MSFSGLFLTNGLEGCHYKLFVIILVVIIVITVLIPPKNSVVCTNPYGTSDCAVPFLHRKCKKLATLFLM